MTTRLKTLALAAFVACALAAPAQAKVLFSQDFSGGLGANESLGGRFAVGGGEMGHVSDPYYVNNERSYYQLGVDLSHVSDAQFSFDWDADTEWKWDGWNLLVAPVGSAFDPHAPLNATPAIYNHFISVLDSIAVSGRGAGHAVFDLTPFAGQAVNLRLQFASDGSIVGQGVRFDNLVVSGTPTSVSAAPEPTVWALMMGGFLGAGAMLRRRSILAA